jgi:UDP-N-acetyl-D-mannosaminuronic acid dehydrogenase
MAMALLANALQIFLKRSIKIMTIRTKTISIIGLGYIGLPTAAVLASKKVKVVGVDVNQHAVNTINEGNIHIIEPDLDMLVHAAVSDGYLRAVIAPVVADAFLIAVPTPFKGGINSSHEPDLSYIRAAAFSIAAVLKKGDLVILESTSPVGATEQLAEWLAQACPELTFPQSSGEDSDIRIAYCPERVLPGKVLKELVQNDRVIGGMTKKCADEAVKLYKIFVQGECVVTDIRSAEMCKLTENSFRDVNIAFANELSIICEKFKINTWELIKLANRHPRVNILQPGPGVGGHCIAVDPWFIYSAMPEHAKLIHAARLINDSKPDWVLERVLLAIDNYLHSSPLIGSEKVSIALFGLAFKPDIDDLRESPALNIVSKLTKMHAGPIYVVEPNIDKLPDHLIDRVHLTSSENALKSANIIVLLVAHSSFKGLNYERTPSSHLIDACGLVIG